LWDAEHDEIVSSMKIIERLNGRLSKVMLAGGITATMVVSALAVATPANAVPHGTSVSIVSSKCVGRDSNGKPTIAWTGAGWENPSKKIYLKTRPSGKLMTCFWKFKFSDRDKKYDYWGASVQSYWVRSKGEAKYSAPANHQISSSKTAKGGVFDGTNSYKSSKSCSQQVDVGVTVGVFSVATPIQACKSYKMTASRVSDSSGYWKIPKVGGFTRVETAYMQKVKQGAKPKFSMAVNYPNYGYKWSDARGHWIPTASLKTVYVKL
jgi:hypothetical protein